MIFRTRVIKISTDFFNYCLLLISMAGFVPKHATLPRVIAITISITFSYLLAFNYQDNNTIGVIYFLVSEVLYLGFIFLVLSEHGYRHWFIKRWGNQEEGYLSFEAVLGILFFHNTASLGFIAATTHGSLFNFVDREILQIILIVMILAGFFIKIWSAKVVSIDIYYWKDMFLGKKITEFVETGPYKFLSNPMYGIGQLQAYALAIWYGSEIGLLAALINQVLIFSFYFTVEKKFIKRIYLNSAT